MWKNSSFPAATSYAAPPPPPPPGLGTRPQKTRVHTRTLVLQCSDDVIAPAAVGEFVHRHIAGSTLVQMEATGHCPNLSAPAETIAALRAFLG